MILSDGDKTRRWQTIYAALELVGDRTDTEAVRFDLVIPLSYCDGDLNSDLGTSDCAKERLVKYLAPIYEWYAGHPPDQAPDGSFNRFCRAVFELSADGRDLPGNSDCIEAIHKMIPNKRSH